VIITVFGLGNGGTVTAAYLAARGHEVGSVDIDDHKVAIVGNGRAPVLELGSGELVAVAPGALRATVSVSDGVFGAEMSLVGVGAPSATSGGTDLSLVKRTTEETAEAPAAPLDRSALHAAVVRSTVSSGTVDDLVAPVGLAASGGRVAMCPEFLREGCGVADFLDPPFTVAGTSDRAVAELLSSLSRLLDEPVGVLRVRTEESVKYACSAFQATNVVFANVMDRSLRPLGIDSGEATGQCCKDHRLNIPPSYLRPGFAFGRPCLPKSCARCSIWLARMNGVDLLLPSRALSSNELVLADSLNRVTPRAA
jgi:GDP-mannose 6-dehydrogenase